MSCISDLQRFVVLIDTLLLCVHCSEVPHDMSRKRSPALTANPAQSYTKQSVQTVSDVNSLTSAEVNDVNSRHQQSETHDQLQQQQHLFKLLNRPFANHDSYHDKQPADRLLTVSLGQFLS